VNEQVDAIKEAITEIKVDTAEIKLDLKYHIKRTDELEKMVLPMYKFRIWLQYTLFVVGTAVTVLTLRGFL
jgi:hypothetical protein